MTIRTRIISTAGAVVALAAVPVVAHATSASAAKAAAKPTVRAAANAAQHRTIVVNGSGRTLYRLAPETTKHLLCTSAACLGAWPPLTIPAHHTPVKGAGIRGKLGVLKRGGKLQVTLNGQPLYTFVGDRRAGQANGEGLASFGGTWHTLAAKGGTTSSGSGAGASSPAPASPAPAPMSPAPTTPAPAGDGW